MVLQAKRGIFGYYNLRDENGKFLAQFGSTEDCITMYYKVVGLGYKIINMNILRYKDVYYMEVEDRY